MSWNPDQYLKFAAPRLRPAIELLARIDSDDPRRIYDLGCGAGNVTRLLLERWPEAEVIGVDDSPSMLAKAAEELPGARWVEQSIADWQAEVPADVVYSNAALHWLPHHDRLLARLAGNVAAGGVLAVQMPKNFAAPSHTLIVETMHSRAWSADFSALLAPSRLDPVADAAAYYGWLAPFAAELDIWETAYLQVLDGDDPVKEWTKGTWLKPFLDALPAAEQPAFEVDYARRLRDAYPPRADGRTLFPFRRLFIVMRKR